MTEVVKHVVTRHCRCAACFGRKVRAHDRLITVTYWTNGDGIRYATRRAALAAQTKET